jgi:hypothetical protein
MVPQSTFRRWNGVHENGDRGSRPDGAHSASYALALLLCLLQLQHECGEAPAWFLYIVPSAAHWFYTLVQMSVEFDSIAASTRILPIHPVSGPCTRSATLGVFNAITGEESEVVSTLSPT